ncbi:MAG: 4'-phosphopantetheinyl transferase superfamily protein [Pseudomonadota bacterium]|nr:4'-phosphopantetheinyl transferase superfamily protein [Xanthomonadaceae bacterium]MDE2247958.1 4'-phosphopantetheinyl transferase superfamily protein [Xanthomonadaceae bacterium]MDE3211178.1 4'-phosphopantetheinyl transferase superfamily protein [Pseudomonadota bacterium]
MITTHALSLATLAEQLHDEEIHVWRLGYQAASGRAPLYAVLAAYLGCDVADVRLVEGAHGRPALAPGHGSTLQFNWSHSGPHALIAVARRVSPGIDVERRRPRPRALQIARRFFAADELALLSRLPAAAREPAFLQLWTAKEAIVKALGRGLAFGLDRLSVGWVDRRLALLRLDGGEVRDWQLHALPDADDATAAIAWQGEARHIRVGTLASGA